MLMTICFAITAIKMFFVARGVFIAAQSILVLI
jgi:hypothetical protein